MSRYLSPDDLLARIRSVKGPYHERAYLFVLGALEYCQQHRSQRGHISGQELSEACRDFAIEQFGLMARTVLSYWGIDATSDLGRIVLGLIDVGLLMKQDSDRLEDFDAVFRFDEVFEEGYPWPGVRPVGGRSSPH